MRDSIQADVAQVRAFVAENLRDLVGLLEQDVTTARAWLARHVESITMTPAGEGKNRYYVASGKWSLRGETEVRDSVGCGGRI